MKRYNNLVLNIPHSSIHGLKDSGWNDINTLVREEVRKWTDWFTDFIFHSDCNAVEVVFKHSRFLVDVERLIHDPLEENGQGIIYTRFNGHTRLVTDEQRQRYMNLYNEHHKRITEAINDSTILIDCHSFPSDVCNEVDICIGFNDDHTKPNVETIQTIENIFKSHGYKTALNYPYSNSIAPETDKEYNSLMIEVNKQCYMDEHNLSLNADHYKLTATLNSVYHTLLNLK